MKITCSGHSKKTGNACSRKVAENGGWCYQHQPEKQIKIPEDISRVIGHRAIITRSTKKPVLIVIDDVLPDKIEDLNIKEVESWYSPIFRRIFKRNKK